MRTVRAAERTEQSLLAILRVRIKRKQQQGGQHNRWKSGAGMADSWAEFQKWRTKMGLSEEAVELNIRLKNTNIENVLIVSGSGKSLARYFRESRQPPCQGTVDTLTVLSRNGDFPRPIPSLRSECYAGCVSLLLIPTSNFALYRSAALYILIWIVITFTFNNTIIWCLDRHFTYSQQYWSWGTSNIATENFLSIIRGINL
jgi:hypothetical protein